MAIRFCYILILVTALTLATTAFADIDHHTPVNINIADANTLAERLTGIGPARAEAIVEFREQHGAFITVEHLEEVPGIGIQTLENNREHVTVD